MANDNYAKVRVILVSKSRNALLCAYTNNHDKRPPFWIGLSLIHGVDERDITNARATDVVEFRLMKWKARELDL